MNLQAHADASGRNQLLLSVLLVVALAMLAILTRPLTPIDETRYVSAAWEMWLRGDFLVPFKNGAPYSHKPPFMFWMIHAGWAVFGVNDWWPRLVMPLFSVGALLLTYLLARRLWPQRAGLGGQATLVLVSSLLWVVFSTSLMFDVMLAFWVLLGMHGVLSATNGKRRGFVMLGIAIGMGVLTKGPVILLNLLPITVLAPWWNLGLSHGPVKERMKWGRWFGGVGLAVLLGAAIALAWAIPAGTHGRLIKVSPSSTPSIFQPPQASATKKASTIASASTKVARRVAGGSARNRLSKPRWPRLSAASAAPK